MQLDKIDFSNGIWRGLLTVAQGSTTPELRVELNGTLIADTTITDVPSECEWIINIPIPRHAIGDGVYTFTIFIDDDKVPIASFCMTAGRAMEYDLQAEVALLREELEILQRAFRRHIHNAGWVPLRYR